MKAREQAKYSEGPWRVEYETRIEYGPQVAGEGFCVAKVLRDPGEWQANARLIAAGPDLLAALLECEAYLWGEFQEDAPGWQHDGAKWKLYEQIKVALAKAEG